MQHIFIAPASAKGGSGERLATRNLALKGNYKSLTFANVPRC
jgi:hypothetical protein